MKVAFIQREAYEKLGVHQLLGCLKKKDVEYDLFIESLEPDFFKKVSDFNPDFILYSLFIGEEPSMVESFSKLKKYLPKVKTVIGGPSTLVFPEIIKKKPVDFLIRGDGEHSLPLFLQRYAQGKSLKNVPGICYIEDNGNVFVNNDFNLTTDLKTLPGPDRDIYYKYEYLRNKPTKIFIASRGCPYNCTFCYNAELKKFYKAPYWRLRDQELIIREIEYVKKRYGLKWVHFQDGTFNANKKWLKQFLEAYCKADLPPFLCNARAENIDDEIVRLLKKAGCNRITFGIQSGNQRIRQKLAGRLTSNEQIIDASRFCKKYGIRVGIDIIFGWPGETLEEAMDTINLCREVNAETYSSNILTFYPKLWITRYASEAGYIKNTPSLEEINRLNPNKSQLIGDQKNLLINIDKLFYLLIRLPNAEKFFLQLLKLPPNRLFYLFKNLHLLLRSIKYDDNGSKFQSILNYISSCWRIDKN